MRYTALVLLASGLAEASQASHVLPVDRLVERATGKRRNGTTWAGVIQHFPNTKTIEATWNVPHCAIHKTDVKLASTVSHWVGIDGGADCTALLQAGMACATYGNNEVTYYSWLEFIPKDPQALNLDVGPGDEIYAKLTATSKTSGVFMENRTTGKNETYSATAEEGRPLCFTTTEWIVEESQGHPGLWMETVRMKGCSAANTKGTKINLDGGDIQDRVVDQKRQQRVEVQNKNDFNILYEGRAVNN
ncbi:hypothetical protein VHEMI00843 [[Torrubiella] hemipterigena]|uniref:Concanavalin A-like lectin/glucanase n=1 Tax=[Torrubiella] hemipterigena TaxID=1531966 RepID=A0A0A1T356_9HYPO|nr:hypothetical protein VHEMI00843 [[Torrubiella] hemipterigena]